MNKYIITAIFLILYSCGSGIEYDGPNSRTYTYILKNNTDIDLLITSDFGRMELIPVGDIFQCKVIVEDGYSGGLCSLELEIRIPNTKKGYRCHGLASNIEGLCFAEDYKIFTISAGTIFTEIAPRTYQYVLTPNLLENVFELPD
ncbi:hypothetical protein [Flagellimonas sp.]|uniref:hypothetical protein n=1 Tax=Flagellimonas sp. TaxID=2058762 RepID=UPI003B5A574A